MNIGQGVSRKTRLKFVVPFRNKETLHVFIAGTIMRISKYQNFSESKLEIFQNSFSSIMAHIRLNIYNVELIFPTSYFSLTPLDKKNPNDISHAIC